MTDRENNGRVWGVVWSEVFPWLIIFRTFRIAISFRLLLLGAAGMMAMLLGYDLIRSGVGGPALPRGYSGIHPVAIQGFGYDTNVGCIAPQNMGSVQTMLPSLYSVDRKNTEVITIWKHFSLPFFWVKNGCHSSTPGCWVAWLWTVLVWGFFGTAIARSAAVQLVSGGRTSFREMLWFAWSKWRAGFAAPLLPFIGMLILAIPIFLLGLLLRLGFLAWIGVVAWPVMIVVGIVIAILMIGLLFGWPLMLAAIAVEGSDSFDALSRAYAYVYQRPLQYLFYVFLALLFGSLGWLFVGTFANLVLDITRGIAGWNMPDVSHSNLSNVIGAWLVLFNLLVMGFLATYFWSAAVAIYLLLRRDTDAVELDEIYTKSEKAPRKLPKIVTDEKGAPAVEEHGT